MLKKTEEKRNSAKWAALGRRLMAFALCLAMSFSLVPLARAADNDSDANALSTEQLSGAKETADKKKLVDNTYLLRVDTGVSPGTNVLYFGVRYRDVNNREHTEYLFPHEGSLSEGYELAEKYGTPKTRLQTVYNVTDYSVENSYEKTEGLTANSSDNYLFVSDYEMKEFLGLDIFMRYPMDGREYTKGWYCSGLYFYRVDEIYGIDMAGYYSDDYYISFRGELMSKLSDQNGNGGVDFALDKTDVLYRLGRESDVEYAISAPTEDEKYYDSHASEFLFKFDFADIYGGGIEALSARYGDGNRIKQPAEALTLSITYEDIYGENKTVNLPVITSALAWAVENGIVDMSLPIAGIAQQGESIMFSGTLPDVKDIKNFRLVYGAQAASYAGIKPADGVIRSERIAMLEKDTFNLTGIQIYNSDVKVNASVNGAVMNLSVDETCTPTFYYTAPDSNGFAMKSGAYDMQQRVKKYDGGSLVPPAEKSDYVVVITTDSMERAGTTEDIQIKFNYVATDGTNKSTNAIDLREAAQNFYGYWPGKIDDAAYATGVSPGGQIAFQLAVTDVNKFTGATFTMNSKNQDDWQMSDFRIYNVKQVGKRQIVWENLDFSDRRITRPFEQSENALIVHYPNLLDLKDSEQDSGKLYLGGSEYTKTISFGENSKSVVEKKEHVDWSKIRYSMTLDEAKQDLGFTDADSKYKVEVKVASDNSSNMEDGDCGSQNLFYFKLIFEGGSSGYVLANQQLTADGFRADRIETFYVTTNEDYGALTAVSIIPGDDLENTSKDPFDKLNISYINVTKQNNAGLAKTWKVDQVGWIDINYRDTGAENAMGGRSGRTEGEMAHTYAVSQRGYSVNLLFTMNTGSYERSALDVNYDASKENPQYAGSMVATVEYYDNSGMIRKQSVDVVRAMYEYANREPLYYNETFQTSDGENETRAKSDPGFMFRGGHVDRFIVSLTDVRQIIRIRFGASSEVSTTWKLKNVNVYTIESEGQVLLSTENEYKRTNTLKELCTSTDDVGYPLKVFAPETGSQTLGEEQGVTVNFTPHVVKVDTSGSEWTASIEKTPSGKNDTLNFYVHMSEAETETPISRYKMRCSFGWNSREEGDANRNDPVGMLEKSADGHMFYMTGVRAAGFNNLNYVTLRAEAAEQLNAHVDYVVVQHVRSGVTIDNFYLPFGGRNADLPDGFTVKYPTEEESSPTIRGTHEKQVVKLFFSENMQETELMKGVNDVVVAIRYRTINDVAKSSTDKFYYNSSYVYLGEITEPAPPGSDKEKQKYTKITPGMIAEVEFNEGFVQEITGVTVASVGSLKATLDSACAGVYDSETGKCLEWYSFANGRELTTTPYPIPTSEENVVPVKMTFKTSEDAKIISTGADSGTLCPIRMKVIYTNAMTKQRSEMTIDDIRKFVTDGSFRREADGSALTTIEFFMKNVDSIRAVTLEPYTDSMSTSAVWGVDQVSCEAMVNRNAIKSTAAVNKLIAEGSPASVNLSTVYVKLKATAFNDETGITEERNTEYNGSTSITVKSGRTVTITPTVVGSLDGYGYTVSAQRGSGIEVDCYSNNGSTVTFTPPVNETANDVTYIVTISSQEMPDVKCSITVTVEGTPNIPQREDPVTPTPAENNTGKEDAENNSSAESGT